MTKNINSKYYHRKRNGEIQDDKPCCFNPIIIPKEGNLVCVNCGTVVGKDVVNLDNRAYTLEEVNQRKTTEKVWRDIGPRTFIDRERKDSKGSLLNAEGKTLFNRLDKIQRSLIDSLERNKWEAKPKLKMLCSKLNIPEYIKETAWRIYIEAAKQKLTMGRSIIAFVAASLYTAIRIHELPRLLDEICDCELVPKKSVHHALGLLTKTVLPSLGHKYKPITSHQLVYRFGNDLNLPMIVQKCAANLLNEALNKGLDSNGKDPRGLAASAIYIASRTSNSMFDRRTQAEVAEVAKITEVTLRSRAKDIRECLD